MTRIKRGISILMALLFLIPNLVFAQNENIKIENENWNQNGRFSSVQKQGYLLLKKEYVEAKIKKLENSKNKLNSNIDEYKRKENDLRDIINSAENAIKDTKENIRNLEDENARKNNEKKNLENKIKELNVELKNLIDRTKSTEIINLENEIIRLENDINRLNKDIKDKENELKSYERQLKTWENEKNKLEKKLAPTRKKISDYEREIAQVKKSINDLNGSNSPLNSARRELNNLKTFKSEHPFDIRGFADYIGTKISKEDFGKNIFDDLRNSDSKIGNKRAIDLIKFGNSKSATSITNLENAARLLIQINNHRQEVGLRRVSPSYDLMIKAAIHTDMASEIISHPRYYSFFENLAWGYSDPWVGWYIREKEQLKEIIKQHFPNTNTTKWNDKDFLNFFNKNGNVLNKYYSKVGHYLNIITIDDEEFTQGYGFNNLGMFSRTDTNVATWDKTYIVSENEYLRTVLEYKDIVAKKEKRIRQLDVYIKKNSKGKETKLNELNNKLNELNIKLRAEKKIISDNQTQLDNCNKIISVSKTNINRLQSEIKNCKDTLNQKNSLLADKKIELKKAIENFVPENQEDRFELARIKSEISTNSQKIKEIDDKLKANSEQIKEDKKSLNLHQNNLNKVNNELAEILKNKQNAQKTLAENTQELKIFKYILERINRGENIWENRNIQGYSRMNQKIRDINGRYLNKNLPRNTFIKGILQDDSRIEFNYQGIKGYVYSSNILRNKIYVKGYSKFDQWIRDSRGNKVAVLSIGAEVNGKAFGDKVYIEYLGKKGYIWEVNLLKEAKGLRGYSKFNQWIRDINGNKLGILKKGAYIYGTFSGNRLKISYKGKVGYIYTVNLVKNPIAISGYTSSNLNVRDINGRRLGVISIGTYVSGKTFGDRVEFNFRGKKGYIYNNYLQNTNPVKSGYAKFTQNIRDKNNKIVGVLPKNVFVTGKIVGNKLEINYKGVKGFIWITNLR